MRAVTRKARSLALDGVYERTVALLEESATTSPEGLRVPPELTQQEIADRIGASREMVNHVLRDDPTDNVANYVKPGPLSPQLTAALDQFVTR